MLAEHSWNESMKPVVVGCLLSALLLGITYCAATSEAEVCPMYLALLGGAQVVVQLAFFLHIGLEKSPRWNLIMFLFTLAIAAIVFVGSIWIMDHIKENEMYHFQEHDMKYSPQD